MSINSVTPEKLEADGFAALRAREVTGKLSDRAAAELDSVARTFEELVQDTQMGDGGRYRFRRYSRFKMTRLGEGVLTLEVTDSHSIHQTLEDNPLNGGVTRTFEPLSQTLMESAFLRELITQDAEIVARLDPDFVSHPVAVGVHQVRILAVGEMEGKPAPEGVHRDAERFTFQHFWARRSVAGGEFVAYDQNKTESFRWLQQERLDSVLFLGSTWHSATPIVCQEGAERGYRDIFLVDFDPLEG